MIRLDLGSQLGVRAKTLAMHDRLLAGWARALTALSLLLRLGVRLVASLVLFEAGGRSLLARDGGFEGVGGSLHIFGGGGGY